MINSIRADLLVLRKRTATWVLLAVAVMMSVAFPYVLPYVAYRGEAAGPKAQADLLSLLPQRLVASELGGFPFYFGMLALILGVLQFGGEYGWGTLKTTLMQRSNRLSLVLAKVSVLVITLLLFSVVAFASGAIASVAIAIAEHADIVWPPAWDLARGIGTGWLLLTLWALFGALLAALSRGTTLAMGLGIVYGLIVEGLVIGFGERIHALREISQGFLRTNGYSLIAPLQAGQTTGNDGPGFFSGPFVNEWQSLLVIAGYVIVFGGAIAILLQRRDVT